MLTRRRSGAAHRDRNDDNHLVMVGVSQLNPTTGVIRTTTSTGSIVAIVGCCIEECEVSISELIETSAFRT